MRRRIILATLVAAILAGCSRAAPEPAAAAKPPVLTGHWMRRGELDGRELTLGIDSAQAVFDSEVDTIYRYTWRRRGDVMEFEDFNGARQGRVVKLTADSLVLELSLPGVTRPMRFWRHDPCAPRG
jgi:type IV pilus biogenesis protein CpaD/CtpE